MQKQASVNAILWVARISGSERDAFVFGTTSIIAPGTKLRHKMKTGKYLTYLVEDVILGLPELCDPSTTPNLTVSFVQAGFLRVREVEDGK